MRMLLVVALASAGLALPAAADPVFGLWRSEPDARGVVSMIQLVDCDDRICGRLVATYDAQGRPLDSPHIGRAFIWGMEPHGSGRYLAGRQWLPERDQDYPARMNLAGDRLTVTHCSVVVVCRDRVWSRAN
jgi:uncharacterized protein (DUF2147 family)